MSEKIKFHDKVTTPNGEGIVQGLLIQGARESVLVSHDPKKLPQGEVTGAPVMPGDHHSFWVLYAYNPAEVQLVKEVK